MVAGKGVSGGFARVALPAAVDRLFDYRIPEGWQVERGSLVRVRFSGRRCDGVVVERTLTSTVPDEKLQALDKVYPLPSLPGDVCQMMRFVSDYYQSAFGMVCAMASPPLTALTAVTRSVKPLRLSEAGRSALTNFLATGCRGRVQKTLVETTLAVGNFPVSVQQQWTPTQKKHIKDWVARGWLVPDTSALPAVEVGPELFDEQQAAVTAVREAFGRFQPFLLQGITGSGKTEVYLTLAREVLARGQQVLVLLPEIHLTPQFLQRVENFLPGVRTALLHSALPDGERLAHWCAAARGEAQLVLGTRLALFTPMPKLGLMVVDEEHDLSFKQQDGVRYHARDVAVWRAKVRNVPIVLGSATPSLESYRHALQGRYTHLRITRRARPDASLPELTLAPATGDTVRDGLSAQLWDALANRLQRHEQALIFINRRGFAPSLKCTACAWEAACPHCSVRLVLHKTPPRLQCHQCGYSERVPPACPQCGNLDLLPRGFGTQRLEAALQRAFPDARLARVDRDSTRLRDAFDQMRAQIVAQEVDIMIGTQMLAKGHDFSHVTLVGVLGADNALYSADFRATEHLSALLHQVSGRAGRAERSGTVIVQTDFPDHPLYVALRRHAFDEYARQLLEERRGLSLPPFAALALLQVESRDQERLQNFLTKAHQQGLALASEHSVQVFSPIAANVSRRADYLRAQIMIHANQRTQLQKFLPCWRTAIETLRDRQVRWAIDVDPV